jgi:MFS family permease
VSRSPGNQSRPQILPISALGLLTIVTYGACYYAYGVLLQPIRNDTHWSDAALGAIFSAILLITGAGGMVAGRWLDRIGEQPIFLLAASLGAGAMFIASFQRSLVPFAIAYAGGCGLVGALGFYHITQSIAARSAREAPARAIIWLTLFGAFAAPIFLPLTGWLVQSMGWRNVIRIDAGIVAIAFLATAAVVKSRSGLRNDATRESSRAVLRLALRSPRMRTWLLATLISGAGVDALIVYEVPAMVRAGLTLTTAASVAGFLGLAQLVGRLPLRWVIGRLGARNTLVLTYCVSGTAALLLLVSGKLALALLFSLLAGASIGALSSLQGIYTHELVDPRHLGALLGTQQAFFGVGGAIGPALGGVLLEASRSYVPTILMITFVFVLAASVLFLAAAHERNGPHVTATKSLE